jgi:hypothetical protein
VLPCIDQLANTQESFAGAVTVTAPGQRTPLISINHQVANKNSGYSLRSSAHAGSGQHRV